MESNDSRTLVIVGKSGYGKTQGMLSLLGPHGVLVVKDINNLRAFKTSVHKIILLVDFDFSKMNIEELKHMFDSQSEAQIRVLYGMIRLPIGVRRVVLCNM